MKWTTPKTVTSAIVTASLFLTFVPISVHATGYGKWLTVYFTRHAEKRTVTEDTGNPANQCKSIFDENEGKVVFIDTDKTAGRLV